MSLSERILSRRKLPMEPVGDIPEWGITKEDGLAVRGLSAKERDEFEGSRLKQKRGRLELVHDNTRARLVAWTLLDKQGRRVFKDSDVEELGEQAAQVLDRLYEQAQRLSGIKATDDEETAEALRKNPVGGSPCSSPGTSDSPT